MKKILIFMLFVSAIFAQEAKWHQNELIGQPQDADIDEIDRWFVGVEAGYERVWGDFGFGFDSVSYNTVNYGIKFGYTLYGDNRIYLNYNRNTDMEDDNATHTTKTTLQKLLLGIDGVRYINESFGIITGGAVGWAQSNTKWSDGGRDKESAFTIGAKVGGIINIGAHSEIEFGLKAGGSLFEETVWNANAYAGYNFKF
ncbi:MAG: hypothetical protein LBB59_01485 [Campylobacteraceae bacterium]|jgi:hypothetical protein|nr:hypothetical protein [Campylobacteraceae bacterium]